jgi:phage/plasmid primase-like uncharacterized protein
VLTATIAEGLSMRSAARDAWVANARSIRIEDECARRDINFNGQSGKSERCGPCPKCGGDDRFSINTKKQVFNCRGCGIGGDIIALVEHLDCADFVHAVETLTGEPPPKPNGKDCRRGHESRRRRHENRIARIEADAGTVKRTQAALSVWLASLPAEETPVAIYLRSRGIVVAPPPSIRFHIGLKHPSGGVWPAMVAMVTNGPDGTPLAIHRTYLGRDGAGKAPVDPQKMMLGPCRGGAVRLADPGEVLMVGEGIETCLATMQATGHPAWAALSTSGLRSLDLPREVRNVIVLADGDAPGEAAAQDAGLRWKREGRHVRIARPPQGMDFNDLLNCRRC